MVMRPWLTSRCSGPAKRVLKVSVRGKPVSSTARSTPVTEMSPASLTAAKNRRRWRALGPRGGGLASGCSGAFAGVVSAIGGAASSGVAGASAGNASAGAGAGSAAISRGCSVTWGCVSRGASGRGLRATSGRATGSAAGEPCPMVLSTLRRSTVSRSVRSTTSRMATRLKRNTTSTKRMIAVQRRTPIGTFLRARAGARTCGVFRTTERPCLLRRALPRTLLRLLFRAMTVREPVGCPTTL